MISVLFLNFLKNNLVYYYQVDTLNFKIKNKKKRKLIINYSKNLDLATNYGHYTKFNFNMVNQKILYF